MRLNLARLAQNICKVCLQLNMTAFQSRDLPNKEHRIFDNTVYGIFNKNHK